MTPAREAVALLNIGVEALEVAARLRAKGVSRQAARQAMVGAVERVALSAAERPRALDALGACDAGA
jgi:hypothetical protein